MTFAPSNMLSRDSLVAPNPSRFAGSFRCFEAFFWSFFLSLVGTPELMDSSDEANENCFVLAICLFLSWPNLGSGVLLYRVEYTKAEGGPRRRAGSDVKELICAYSQKRWKV